MSSLQDIDVLYSSVLIWDSEEAPPDGDWITVLWRSFSEGDRTTYSIPSFIEEHSDELKSRFLAWVYELGETLIDGRRLFDHLELRPGFSYWWMTLLVEKSYGKSPCIYDAIRLFAFEKLIAPLTVNKVILVSDQRSLADTIRSWCANRQNDFEWRRKRHDSESLRKCASFSFPYPVRAVATLIRYLMKRWPLIGQQVKEHGKITFVDYLVFLDNKALSAGRFASHYWTKLSDVFENTASRVNWLHHYVPHEAIASARQAKTVIGQFNETGGDKQFHFCLDSVLKGTVIWAAILDYLRIALMHRRLTRVKDYFRPANSDFDFWLLFKNDWRNSMSGPVAISNSLFLNLFEEALKSLPHQEMGFYLQENQAWEQAFIYVWKALGHGKLVGVQHATVRYWDLRYFSDPQSYERKDYNEMPMPDGVALNGNVSIDAFRDGGYPENKMFEVEALRYLHLTENQKISSVNGDQNFSEIRVLVLTDYLHSSTCQQMQWLEYASRFLPENILYIVKSHPASPVKEVDYPSIAMQITNFPIEELLTDCDVAYTSNITSAAVDVYLAGVPVISVLDGNTFNMSPLRGFDCVQFVASAKELTEAIKNSLDSPLQIPPKDYFTLDTELPRWNHLIKEGKSEVVGSI